MNQGRDGTTNSPIISWGFSGTVLARTSFDGPGCNYTISTVALATEVDPWFVPNGRPGVLSVTNQDEYAQAYLWHAIIVQRRGSASMVSGYCSKQGSTRFRAGTHVGVIGVFSVLERRH